MHCLSGFFWVQLFILRFIDLMALFSLSRGVVFHCMSMQSFIHSSTDGQWVLATMNKDVVNIPVYIFFWWIYALVFLEYL